MKIIQSFWSKPSFHDVQDYQNSRKFSGWLNFRYFVLSAAYSCLTIRKTYKKVDLYTDTQGSGLLIDLLNLPYENVSLALNELDQEDHRLWISGKLKAIRLQDKPFIHVDNDVYIWNTFPNSSSKDFLIAQSRTPIWTEYKLSLNEIFANFSYIPECLKERPSVGTMVANVGVIGGNDMDFFYEFSELSLNLLEKNRSSISLVEIGGFNQMMEEYLFSSMIRYKGIDICYLLESVKSQFPISHLNFNLVPLVYKYVHLIGMNKQNRFSCEQIELRLKYEFPDYYKKVYQVINELIEPEESNALTGRQEQLFQSLHFFYTRSLSEIENMKIRIKPGLKFFPIKNYSGYEHKYIIQQTDLHNGEVTFKSLPSISTEAAEYWLSLFESPITLLEIYKTLDQLSSFKDDQEYINVRFKIINAITANIVIVGVMEFV